MGQTTTAVCRGVGADCSLVGASQNRGGGGNLVDVVVKSTNWLMSGFKYQTKTKE